MLSNQTAQDVVVPHKERREHPRHAVSFRVYYFYNVHSSPTAHLLDLSYSGAAAKSAIPLPIGSRQAFLVVGGDKVFHCQGIVLDNVPLADSYYRVRMRLLKFATHLEEHGVNVSDMKTLLDACP